ncbi:hypothetical protein Hanom_Chr07g00589861 [Helianthus anomalus]
MGYLFPCVAAKDVVRKVLSEPIRPQFAIASVDPWYYHHRLEAHKLISTKLGSKVPVITILSKTNMGRDAIFNESEEVYPYKIFFFLSFYSERINSLE